MIMRHIITCIFVISSLTITLHCMDVQQEPLQDNWDIHLTQLIKKTKLSQAQCVSCQKKLTSEEIIQRFMWAKSEDCDSQHCFICVKKTSDEDEALFLGEESQLVLKEYYGGFHFHKECHESFCQSKELLLCTACQQEIGNPCKPCCECVTCCCDCIRCFFSGEGIQLISFFAGCIFDRCTQD